MATPLTLDEIYNFIINEIGGPEATDITLGNLLLALGAAIKANQSGDEGVTSFNTRTGVVTLTAADVEGLFTASNQIFVGTGSGTGTLRAFITELYDQFTAAGQLIVGTGTATGELLAAGTDGYVLTSNGPGVVPSWQAATGDTPYVLAQVQYDPASTTTYTPAGTLTALDTTNLTIGPFVVPASGEVVLEASMFGTASALGATIILLALGFTDHTSAAQVGPFCRVFEYDVASGSILQGTVTYRALVAMTPGASVQLDLAAQATISGGSGVVTVGAGGNPGPALITVYDPSATGGGGGGGGGVTAAEIEATFTAAGQLYQGTGSGTGEQLAAGTDGYVLTSNGPGEAVSWQAVEGGSGDFLPIFNVLDYGATGNGTADDKSAFGEAFAAAAAAGGGIVFYGPLADGAPGNYLFKETLTLPVTTTETEYAPGSPPIYTSVPLILASTGGAMNPRGDVPVGTTTLTFNPTTTGEFMIQGLGQGSFEVRNCTILNHDPAGTAALFLMTNMVSNVHDNAFVGPNAGTACVQDVIQYGTYDASTANGGTSAIFQGYGSVYANNKHGGIRHMATLYVAANDVNIRDNNIYNTCGTNLSSDGPIVINGTGGTVTGCTVGPNSLEMMGVNSSGTPVQTGYAYGIVCTSATLNTFIQNSLWDLSFGGTPSSHFVSGIYFDSNSSKNKVWDGNTSTSVSSPPYVWATGNTTGNQLLTAVPEIIGTGPSGVTGALPQPQLGGYFIQSATTTAETNSSGYITVSFPATFPNGVLSVVATCNGTENTFEAGECWVGQVANITTSGFQVFFQAPPGSPANEDAFWTAMWIAIGF